MYVLTDSFLVSFVSACLISNELSTKTEKPTKRIQEKAYNIAMLILPSPSCLIGHDNNGHVNGISAQTVGDKSHYLLVLHL